MKNQAPQDSDLHKLGELIDGIEVAMLTTHAEDGSLVSRPLQTLKLDAEGNLVFFTSNESRKVEEMTQNLEVNLAYAKPSEQRYVSIRGRARIDRDAELIDELWSPMQKVFFPEGKNDPALSVLRVRVRDASYWEGADNVVERVIDIARGLLSDDPGDIGKHGHLEG